MMKYQLPFIPERPEKPRQSGITMMMDKGLSIREVENFLDSCDDFTDLVKFGFGTALITKDLKSKINLYKDAHIIPYLGGTLFEIFHVRNLFDDFCSFIEKYDLELVEISDGSMKIPHDEKLACIEKLSKRVTVISEVGSKLKDVVIPIDKWISMMQSELNAGSWKVIAEAREAGNVGIYNSDGSANKDLIIDIVNHVKSEDIIWEAPNKNQQVYFIKLAGPNVNLGNIAPHDVFSLETLRLGLRGDTFFDFLPNDYNKFKP